MSRNEWELGRERMNSSIKRQHMEYPSPLLSLAIATLSSAVALTHWHQ